MPESIQHQQLVKVLREEVLVKVPSDCSHLIQMDSPESLNSPPKTIEGYRADVYYKFEDLLIIGEAKTSDDVGKKHSRTQYESFLRECSKFQGQAVFILVVPLLEKASANNILYATKCRIPGNYSVLIKGWIEGS